MSRPNTTKQLRAVRTVLTNAERPQSIEEICAGAREYAKSLGIATVYRIVKRLVDTGAATAIGFPSGPRRFEVSGLAHHHFECRACGRVWRVPDCGPRLEHVLPPPFHLAGHQLILWGRCDECVGSVQEEVTCDASC